MLFAPIFFASIGLNIDFSTRTVSILLFGLTFVVVGLISKVLGCTLAAKCLRYNIRDSFIVGLGMMARAEVAIIATTKGIEYGIIKPDIMPFVVILIIVSSFITPVVLQWLFKHDSTNLEGEIPVESSSE